MKNPIVLVAALVAAFGLAALAIAKRPQATPPAAQLEVLERVPFVLAEPSTHWYRIEQPRFSSGELVVVRSHGPDLGQRALATPVLYCGGETAQQLNRGETGVAVCVVPQASDRAEVSGLGNGPWFQGAPNLPERVTLPLAEAELEAARRRGVVLQEVEPAARLELANEKSLLLVAADLIEKHAPDEADTVRGIRGY